MFEQNLEGAEISKSLKINNLVKFVVYDSSLASNPRKKTDNPDVQKYFAALNNVIIQVTHFYAFIFTESL